MTGTQQGVAQRLLDDMAAMVGGIEGHRYAGAKTLEMNLSAEARRVLRIYRDSKQVAEERGKHGLAADTQTRIEGMEVLAMNLGLDLEGDES